MFGPKLLDMCEFILPFCTALKSEEFGSSAKHLEPVGPFFYLDRNFRIRAKKLNGDSVEKLQMTCAGCDGRGAFSLNQTALTHTFVLRSVGHVR